MPMFQHSAGTTLETDDRPYFSTADGGVIVTDDALARLWMAAASTTLDTLVDRFHDAPLADIVPEALACLVRAGLLRQLDEPLLSPHEPQAPSRHDASALVTIAVVVSSPRELQFLDDCLGSIARSTHERKELLLVDNESGADLQPFLDRHCSSGRLLRLSARVCLSAGTNAALAAWRAPYALLMNPDVKLAATALTRLVMRARMPGQVAAVVPKTRFWRTPAFINAIGNRVTPLTWGTDNGIGQLDLGQFDRWTHAPSASLTIQLVTREAWHAVGPFDERYAAYYEDADWAYRARLMGWEIRAEPKAEAFHIFGGFWDAAGTSGLTPRKLETASAGRLQWACKIAGPLLLGRLLKYYLIQDAHNAVNAARARRWEEVRAYARAWIRALTRAPRLIAQRWTLQRRRVVDDAVLFPPEHLHPKSYTHRNSPLLTSAIVRTEYVPILRAREATLSANVR